MNALKKQQLKTLFLSTFRLSACTFGGGFVIIPLMKKRFVDQLGWLEEQEMLDLTAISQSAPGPIAVNASILVGYRIAGVPGALLSVLGSVLPPLIIITVISEFYRQFRDAPIVNMAMAGMLCGVVAVILDVVINMIRALFKQKRVLPFFVLVFSFIAARYLNINIILIILICGCIGAADVLLRHGQKKEADKP